MAQPCRGMVSGGEADTDRGVINYLCQRSGADLRACQRQSNNSTRCCSTDRKSLPTKRSARRNRRHDPHRRDDHIAAVAHSRLLQAQMTDPRNRTPADRPMIPSLANHLDIIVMQDGGGSHTIATRQQYHRRAVSDCPGQHRELEIRGTPNGRCHGTKIHALAVCRQLLNKMVKNRWKSPGVAK